MRVLLVDDDNEMRRIAALALTRGADMDVVEADSGIAGLAMALRTRPDVILLDVVMPGLDGGATLGLLKAHDMTASIPVIMLTARTPVREIERLFRLGASGTITKPFDPRRLAAEVRRTVDTTPAAPLVAEA